MSRHLTLTKEMRDALEIQLRLIGHSEHLVLQSVPMGTDWIDNFVIEQGQEGYHLKTATEELVFFKQAKQVSPTKRLLAQSLSQELAFYEEKRVDKLWEPAYWQGVFCHRQDTYKLNRVGSGTKGDLLPVIKNREPIAVFAVGNLSVPGKRMFSLYTDAVEEVEQLLLLYVMNYLRGADVLSLDLLEINYSLFYAFSGRSALTDKHISMLPESRHPSLAEAIFWWLSGLVLVGVIGFISPKHLLLSLASIALFYLFVSLTNLKDKFTK